METRKHQIGLVVSDRMAKTLVVEVKRRVLDPMFKKYLTKVKKFIVHDEKKVAKMGDRVEIVETKPLSRTKRWRLKKVLTA